MDYFLPYPLGVYLIGILGLFTVNWILLLIYLVTLDRTHEFIVDADRDIGSSNLTLRHLGIDKTLRIRMLDGYREHQSATSPVLCHFTGRIGITFHKRHQTGRGQSRVFHRRAFWSDMGKVMADTASSFHQLNLFLIDLHDPPVRIRWPVRPDYKTVGKGSDPKRVADPCHGASLRNDIFEVLHQIKNLIFTQRVGIVFLYPCDFPGYSPVHIIRSQFEQGSIRILQSILVYPYAGSKFIAFKIL